MSNDRDRGFTSNIQLLRVVSWENYNGEGGVIIWERRNGPLNGRELGDGVVLSNEDTVLGTSIEGIFRWILACMLRPRESSDGCCGEKDTDYTGSNATNNLFHHFDKTLELANYLAGSSIKVHCAWYITVSYLQPYTTAQALTCGKIRPATTPMLELQNSLVVDQRG